MISVLMDVDVLDRLSSIYGAFFNGGLMCFWLRQHRAQRVPHLAFGLVRNDNSRTTLLTPPTSAGDK
jgi:hypothetical protein